MLNVFFKLLKPLVYLLTGSIFLFLISVGLFIYFDHSINLNPKLLENFIQKKFKNDNIDHKINVKFVTLKAGSKLSNLKLEVSGFNLIDKHKKSLLKIPNAVVEINIASLFLSQEFKPSISLGGIPINLSRNHNNEINIKLDKYELLNESSSEKNFLGRIATINSLQIFNSKIKIYDEIAKMALALDAQKVDLAYLNDNYVLSASGTIPQNNFDEATFEFTATYFFESKKTIIDSVVQNIILDQVVINNDSYPSLFKIIKNPLTLSSQVELNKNRQVVTYSGKISSKNLVLSSLNKLFKDMKISNFFISYNFSNEFARVNFEKIIVETNDLKLLGSGELFLNDNLNARFSFPNVSFNQPENKKDLLQIKDSKVELNLLDGSIVLTNTSFKILDTLIEVNGIIPVKKGFREKNFLSFKTVNADVEFFEIINLVNDPSLKHLIGSIKSLDDCNLVLNLEIGDSADLGYRGYISFSESVISVGSSPTIFKVGSGLISFDKNKVILKSKESLLISPKMVNFRLSNFNLTSSKANDKFKLGIISDFKIEKLGSDFTLSQLFNDLNISANINFSLKEYFQTDNFQGRLVLESIDSNFLSFNYSNIDASVSFEEFMIKSDYLNDAITISDIFFKTTEHDIVANINGTLNGMPIKGDFKKVFIDDVAATLHSTGKIKVSDFNPQFLNKTGYSGHGEIQFQSTITFPPNNKPIHRLNADLKNTSLNYLTLGYTKIKGMAGTVEFGWSQDGLINFYYKTAELDVTGRLFVNHRQDVTKLELTKIVLADYFEGKALYIFGGLKNKLIIEGKRYDYSKSPQHQFISSNVNTDVDVRISNVKITENLMLNSFVGTFVVGNNLTGSGMATLNTGPEIKIKLIVDSKEKVVAISSKNAGAVLLESNVYSSGYGGEIEFKFVQGSNSNHNGSVLIKNLKVIGAPFLAKLISLTSVEGIIDVLSSNGIIFTNIEADYQMNDNLLTISDGVALNSSFGLTLSGTRQMDKKIINYSGLLSPAFSLNGMVKKIPVIGNILGGDKGEGAFGINYFATGKINDPKISVNPLSIIAPGQFRNFLN